MNVNWVTVGQVNPRHQSEVASARPFFAYFAAENLSLAFAPFFRHTPPNFDHPAGG